MVDNLSQYTNERIPDIDEAFRASVRDMRIVLKVVLTGTKKAWYVVEYDGLGHCFGFVATKQRIDPSYFSLNDINALETAKNKIQVDTKFEPVTIPKLLADFWFEEWGL